MKTASVSDIKKELAQRSVKELQELCLQLIKFSKLNKEFASYQLFMAGDSTLFLQECKEAITFQIDWIRGSRNHIVKKSLRKVLKEVQKNIKFMDDKEAELQLLLHFCREMSLGELYFRQDRVVQNIYFTQLKKADKILNSLHEDLQYEYRSEYEQLMNILS